MNGKESPSAPMLLFNCLVMAVEPTGCVFSLLLDVSQAGRGSANKAEKERGSWNETWRQVEEEGMERLGRVKGKQHPETKTGKLNEIYSPGCKGVVTGQPVYHYSTSSQLTWAVVTGGISHV